MRYRRLSVFLDSYLYLSCLLGCLSCTPQSSSSVRSAPSHTVRISRVSLVPHRGPCRGPCNLLDVIPYPLALVQ
ncbi:hypothetical protein EDB83DRAFT_2366661 [Lactarius deliciosus]|nr:hypothetical protein EDB83DRAFT_2366661 [Lactarius deliciosus]